MGNETSKLTSRPQSLEFSRLEKILQDGYEKPSSLPMDFLKAITHDFSKERELGNGGFGIVYKGVLQNGKEIAVKMLRDVNLDDDQFQKEVTILYGLKHRNIVQLVGYCAESKLEYATLETGKHVMAEVRNKRFICFEYLNNKSLDEYISAESCGLEWHKRYELIRGICCGLQYLHIECRIVHLDLKPQNILLDGKLVPKIADFGMSRLFGEQCSRIITSHNGGTLGYMAPEYIQNGLISMEADIFSFGVIIIEIVTGYKHRPNSEASLKHFRENVVANWRKRLLETRGPMHKYLRQVNKCILIGLMCVDPDPKKRPLAEDIMKMLDAVDYKCLGVPPDALLETEADTYYSSDTDDDAWWSREAPSWVAPAATAIVRVLVLVVLRK